MKVYLFNIASGLYEGEDFRDSGEVREDEGITSLAPPENLPGQVPVYDHTTANWKLLPIDSLRKAVKGND